jgi:hypothetical protein
MATTSSKANPLAAQPGQKGIDPRGPRFGAAITTVLLAVTVVLALVGPSVATGTTIAERLADPAFWLLAAITVLFAWGAFGGIQSHPYGRFFRAVIAPRLGKPSELENPKPPTFAQLIGFVIGLVGIVLDLIGVPYGLVVAAAFAFVAAFLNSVFGYCLGCQIYVLLARAGIVGRGGKTA